MAHERELPDGTIIRDGMPKPCVLCGRLPEQVIWNIDPEKVLGGPPGEESGCSTGLILPKLEGQPMKNFQHRLRRLERQVGQAFERRLATMPQAEFFALAGLPPQPTRTNRCRDRRGGSIWRARRRITGWRSDGSRTGAWAL